jgi:hypothetical protein
MLFDLSLDHLSLVSQFHKHTRDQGMYLTQNIYEHDLVVAAAKSSGERYNQSGEHAFILEPPRKMLGVGRVFPCFSLAYLLAR